MAYDYPIGDGEILLQCNEYPEFAAIILLEMLPTGSPISTSISLKGRAITSGELHVDLLPKRSR
jgi:hypothetical protein